MMLNKADTSLNSLPQSLIHSFNSFLFHTEGRGCWPENITAKTQSLLGVCSVDPEQGDEKPGGCFGGKQAIFPFDLYLPNLRSSSNETK